MRRLLSSLVLLTASATLSACSGADAKRAEALLQQAQIAQKSISSETFVMKFGIDAPGMTGQLAMQGGAYLRGPRKGDFYMTMDGQGFPGANAMSLTLVRKGSGVTVRGAGQTISMSVPQAQAQFGNSLGDMSQLLDLAKYVDSVSVDEQDYQGRPADRIVGTIDMKKILGSLGGGSFGSALFDKAGLDFGNPRVVLFIPRDTHVVEVMLADMTMSAQGKSVKIHISFAVSGVNRPVEFPLL